MNHKHPAFELTLADGTHWSIEVRDLEAAKIVELLGSAMMLQLGQGQGRRLLVEVDGRTPEAGKVPSAKDQDPVVCVLTPPSNNEMLAIQMMNLSLAIAREAQTRGGVLLHGALTEWNGRGVILAGSGNEGKTTACSRLPVPWHSLCDDTTLAVKDLKGQYWAHPWPIWSLFYQNGPSGSWNVQHAVPLKAIFFLSQSSHDKVEPLNRAQAASMIMTSTQQVSRSMTRKCSDDEIQALYVDQMAAAEALALSVRHRCARMLSGLYQRLADMGTFHSVLPSKLQPQVVSFQTSRYLPRPERWHPNWSGRAAVGDEYMAEKET